MSAKRTGTIYMLTLASAVVLVALVLGLSYILIQARQTASTNTDIERARIHAELGIRHALRFTLDAPNWRQILPSGQWLQDVHAGDANYSLTGIDPLDNNLQNDNTHTVILTCTASLNDLSRIVQVKANNAPSLLLKYALAAGQTISISDHVRVNGDITTNGDIKKSGGDTWVFGNAEAVGTISDTTNISGTIAPGSNPKSFPDEQTIINYYMSRATIIPYAPMIENELISHTRNPFGQINPNGLYKIDCAMQKIVIRDCRIVGTLVLANCDKDSRIESAINWQPARPDYPALIVLNGDFQILTSKNLIETQVGVDFNLPGEPGYGSDLDVFPNLIQGTIYSTGNLTVAQFARIAGSVIVTGNVELKDTSIIQTDSTCYTNPPKGFRETYLSPVPGSWRELIPKPEEPDDPNSL